MLMCKFINKHVIKNNVTDYKDVIEYIEWYLLTNILPNYPVIQLEWKNNCIFRNNSMDLNLKIIIKEIFYLFIQKQIHHQ